MEMYTRGSCKQVHCFVSVQYQRYLLLRAFNARVGKAFLIGSLFIAVWSLLGVNGMRYTFYDVFRNCLISHNTR